MTTEEINHFKSFSSSLELLLWLKARAEKQTRSGKISLAEFAKRGGFKSRAFVGAVFTGKRKLTDEAIDAFAKMLGASVSEKRYISALVRKERGNLEGEKEVLKIQKKFANRLLRRKVKFGSDAPLSADSLSCHTFQVYAGLAGIEHAKTLAEISKIAGLSADLCQKELDHLIHKSCVMKIDDKFYSTEEHLMVAPETSPGLLKDLFLEDISLIQKSAKDDFCSKERLFVTYNFGVTAEQLPLLTAKLREVLNAWVEEHIEKVPERVVSLTVAMT